MGATDEALAALAAGGDRGAFEELVNRHRMGVYRLARSVTGCHADADDAAQEAFLRIYRALGDYDPGRPFRAWMMRIAYNASLTVRRTGRGARIRPAGDELPDPPDPAPSALERLDEAEQRSALARRWRGCRRTSGRPWCCGTGRGCPIARSPRPWAAGSAR